MLNPPAAPDIHFGDQYLRLIGHQVRHYPKRLDYSPRDWIRPKLFTFFVDLINLRVKEVTWIVVGDRLEQNPVWRENKDLKAFAVDNDVFAKEPHYLITDTLNRAMRCGYLSRTGTRKISATVTMIEILSNWAKDSYKHLAGRVAPEKWNIHSKDWQPFNETMYRFMQEQIGQAWRNLRIEIHEAIDSVTKAENRKDYFGFNPEYWAIVNFLVLIGPMDVIQCHVKIGEYGLLPVIDTMKITESLKWLHGHGVLERAGDVFHISSAFSNYAETFVRAIRENYPRLQNEAARWSSG